VTELYLLPSVDTEAEFFGAGVKFIQVDSSLNVKVVTLPGRKYKERVAVYVLNTNRKG